LEELYEGHAGFSVKDFLQEKIDGDELTPATVKVSRHALDRFRAEMPCTSSDEEILPDGGIVVEVLVCSMPWFCGWLLGFGTEVEALEPPELRESLREAAMAVAARYAEDFAGV
jgi:predicted DNA-binding transcriptional regulator YafY